MKPQPRYQRGFIVLFVVLCSGFLMAQATGTITLLDNFDQYGSYNDIWGYEDELGNQYAFLGVSNGTSIVDITDGTANEIAFISSCNSTWKDLKRYGDYLYSVTECSGGLQIIDISDLPNSASLAATWTGFTTSHNIYIDEAAGILYAEGDFSDPMRVISLADPLNPVEIATFGISNHDVYARDGYCYVSEGSFGSVGIYDVANPASPTLVERLSIPAAGYVHNTWLTDDGNYMMSTEETTGKTVKMWDIQDLGNIELTDEYLGPNNFAHNVHIDGDYAYIAHYSSGLRIVDITDPNNIFEDSFYDTQNAWGVYPYYSDGKVVVSDINEGLYVLEFDPSGSGGGLPCGDVRDLRARCQPGNTLQAMLRLWDNSHSGETVTFVINGSDSYSVTINNDRARLSIPGYGPGTHSVEVTEALACVGSTSANCTGLVADNDNWEEDEAVLPTTTELLGNFPNPFNPSTSIQYALSEDAFVTLKVYNTLGQEVRSLVNAHEAAGAHAVSWDGRDASGNAVASGIYMYQLRTANNVLTGRMLLSK